jgi:hypothetical protein
MIQYKHIRGGIMADMTPIERLANIILNQATAQKVQAVLLDENAKGKSILLKYNIAGHWRKMESPPRFLWGNLRNVYLLWAGFEFWHKGAFSGIIKRDDIVQAWSLKVSEAHDKLEFNPAPRE